VYFAIFCYGHLVHHNACSDVTVANCAYVDKAFFTQDNTLKFGTPYVVHAVYT
jgi:hypothetical protein